MMRLHIYTYTRMDNRYFRAVALEDHRILKMLPVLQNGFGSHVFPLRNSVLKACKGADFLSLGVAVYTICLYPSYDMCSEVC